MAKTLYDTVNKRPIRVGVGVGEGDQTPPIFQRKGEAERASRQDTQSGRALDPANYIEDYDEGTNVETDIVYNRGEQLDTWDRLGRTIGAATWAGSGIAIQQIGYMINLPAIAERVLLGGLPSAAESAITDLGQSVRDVGDVEGYKPYSNEPENPDAGIMESFTQWSTLKGIIESGLGFGLSGGFAGGGVGAMSKLLVRKKGMEYLAKTIGSKLRINPQSLAAAAIQNYGEGTMMAIEMENELMTYYKPYIDAGTITLEDAQKEIVAQTNKFQQRNMVFMATDYMNFSSFFFNFKGVSPTILGTVGKTVRQTMVTEYFEETGQAVLQAEGEYKAKHNAVEQFGLYPEFEKQKARIKIPKTEIKESTSRDGLSRLDLELNDFSSLNKDLNSDSAIYKQHFNKYYSSKEGQDVLKKIREGTSDEAEVIRLASDHFTEVLEGDNKILRSSDDWIKRTGDSFMSTQTQVEGLMGAISGPGQWLITSSGRIKKQTQLAKKEFQVNRKTDKLQKAFIANINNQMVSVQEAIDDANQQSLNELEDSESLFSKKIPGSIPDVNKEKAVEEEVEEQENPTKPKWPSEILMKDAWATVMFNTIANGSSKSLKRLLKSKVDSGNDLERERATALLKEFETVEKLNRQNKQYYNPQQIARTQITLKSWKEMKAGAERDDNVSEKGINYIDSKIEILEETIKKFKSRDYQLVLLGFERKKRIERAKKDKAESTGGSGANDLENDTEATQNSRNFGTFLKDVLSGKRGMFGRKNKKKPKTTVNYKPSEEFKDITVPENLKEEFDVIAEDIDKGIAKNTKQLESRKTILAQKIKDDNLSEKDKKGLDELQSTVDKLTLRKEALLNVISKANKNKEEIKDLKAKVDTEVKRLVKRKGKSYDPKFDDDKGDFVFENTSKAGKNHAEFVETHKNKKLEDIASEKELKEGVEVEVITTDAAGKKVIRIGTMKEDIVGDNKTLIISLEDGEQLLVDKEDTSGLEKTSPYQKNGKLQISKVTENGRTKGGLVFNSQLRISTTKSEYADVTVTDTQTLDGLSDDLHSKLRKDTEGEEQGTSFYDKVHPDDVEGLKVGLSNFILNSQISDEYAELLQKIEFEKIATLPKDHQEALTQLQEMNYRVANLVTAEFTNDHSKEFTYLQEVYLEYIKFIKRESRTLNNLYNEVMNTKDSSITTLLDAEMESLNKSKRDGELAEVGEELNNLLDGRTNLNITTIRKMISLLKKYFPVVTFKNFIVTFDEAIGVYLDRNQGNGNNISDSRDMVSDKFLELKKLARKTALKEIDAVKSYEEAIDDIEEESATDNVYSESELEENGKTILTNYKKRQSKLESEERSPLFKSINALVRDAFNKIAYLSKEFVKSFTQDEYSGVITIEISDLDDIVTWSKAISPDFGVGDDIVLTFEEGYEGPINFNGDEMPYKDFVEKYKDDETINLGDYIPIRISDTNGELIGYLHTPNFIKPRNIVGSLSTNLKKLKLIRDHIANNKSITTKVTHKGSGYFIEVAREDRKPTSESVGDDIRVFIGGLGGRLLRGKSTKNTVLLEDTEILLGNPYIEVPTGNKDEPFAYVPVSTARLNEQQVNTIKEALRIYASKDSKDATLNRLSIAQGRSDLTTTTGIKTFLKKYIHFGSYVNQEAFSQEHARRAMENKATFSVIQDKKLGDKILLGAHQMVVINKNMTEDEIDVALAFFENEIVNASNINLKINIDNLLLDSTKFSALEYTLDKKVVDANLKDGVAQSYNEYVKKNTVSHITGIEHINDDGTTTWAYTIQNTVHFDYSFVPGINDDNSGEEIMNRILEARDDLVGINDAGDEVDLNSGEEYSVYKNIKTGKVYQRVSEFIAEEGAEYPPGKGKQETFDEYENRLVEMGLTPNQVYQAKLIASSQIIGNKIDEMIRDFFDGNLKPLSEYDVSSESEVEIFIQHLTQLKETLDANNEVVVANDIVLFNDELGIAGTVDLITYDDKGNIRIYDIKSMRGDQFTKDKYGTRYDSTIAFRMTERKKKDGSPVYVKVSGKTALSKRQKHTNQLSMYRILLNNTFGAKAVELYVIPVEVQYSPGNEGVSRMSLEPLVAIEPLAKVKTAELIDEREDESTTDDKETARGEDRTDNEDTKGLEEQQVKPPTKGVDQDVLDAQQAIKDMNEDGLFSKSINEPLTPTKDNIDDLIRRCKK